MSDFNERVIDEFRANGGVVGGPFDGASLLLLTTTGRRTGQARTTPLVYTPVPDDEGGGYAVAASNAGADAHPAWYLNIEKDPRVTIEVGSDTVDADAVVAAPPDRDRLYARHAERMPGFADYERRTERTIPVVVLRPA